MFVSPSRNTFFSKCIKHGKKGLIRIIYTDGAGIDKIYFLLTRNFQGVGDAVF